MDSNNWSIEQARVRLAAATPGPWTSDVDGETGDLLVDFGAKCGGYSRNLWFGDMENTDREDHTNATFIANAPTDMANLLALVDRLQAVCAEQAETIKAQGERTAMLNKVAQTSQAVYDALWADARIDDILYLEDMDAYNVWQDALGALEQEGSKV